jgi:hypothetical protein
LHNEKLHKLCSTPDIIRMIKSRKMRLSWLVVHKGEKRRPIDRRQNCEFYKWNAQNSSLWMVILKASHFSWGPPRAYEMLLKTFMNRFPLLWKYPERVCVLCFWGEQL